jgi:hypothetical protein
MQSLSYFSNYMFLLEPSRSRRRHPHHQDDTEIIALIICNTR